MTDTFLPGSTIGILGGGQLGRMLTLVARRLGYRVHVFSPDHNSPAGQVSDVECVGDYEDPDAVTGFARQVDVVTFEFENVPAACVDIVERCAPVCPGRDLLMVTQNRIREKMRLRQLGLPTAPFRLVRTANELGAAVREFGDSGILKTTHAGYDGKGQVRVDSAMSPSAIWESFGAPEGIVEGVVDYVREFSVIGARGVHGDIRCYDPIINYHRNHILDVSLAPAVEIPPLVRARAIEMTQTLLESFDVIGIICVEFFQTDDEAPVVNEIAPRPHNSGHLTIDAHVTCQFEQQLRAVCGLPLGSTEQREPAAMANLLGDLWVDRHGPNWSAVMEWPRVKLQLYGKSVARDGRKMGHITALAKKPCQAMRTVIEARKLLGAERERLGGHYE